jgi:hypothetical protein
MLLSLLAATLIQTTPAGALQERPELVPGTTYDPAIPTLEQVEGHRIRDEITPPDGIARYLAALAEAAPDRARFIEYGRTWEGRPMHMLVLGSAGRIARLEALEADLRRLADPRGLSAEDQERLVAELPVVVALVHGVHGNEISSGGAAMATAYHLLAATNDPVAERVMGEVLVLVDPDQNPDGRARFVQSTVQNRGRWADADPLSAEHDEPWPGGRGNHYLFDLNRDWFAQTQPESRGRVAMLLRFMPHVVADIHEMGGNSTYYFPPNAVPGNPWTTPEQASTLDRLGAAMAGAFDARGFRYFNRDTYDAFYAGYGVSWPMAQGAVGMTFEQASARGLVYRRSDGSVLTYGQGVLQHFTSSRATLDLAARERERLLREFVAFRRSASDLGRGRSYVLHSAHDPALARRLAGTLVANGIEVRAATEAVSTGGRTLEPNGTYVVPLEQPAHRLIRNLLDRHTPMDSSFVAEQVRRRDLRLRDQIYDVTAWSQPLLWDVELFEVRGIPGAGVAVPRGAGASPGTAAVARPDPDAVAYLMPWGTATAAAVAELLRQGITVRATGAELTLAGRVWPVGTAIVRPSSGGPDVADAAAAAAGRHGADLVAVSGSYAQAGSSFGSNATRTLRLPRIVLAWDQPASSYSAGWARYVLERRYGLPVTVVRGSSLGRLTLSEYDVLVLPSGNWSGVVGDALEQRLRTWLSEGGTLITLAEASRWAARAGLLATSTELRGGAPEFGEGSPGVGRTAPVAAQPIDPVASLAPTRESPEPTPGAILNLTLDRGHWLAAGTDGRIGVMVEGSRVFSPLTLDRGTNVGRYAGLDDLVASGIVWAEAHPQLAHKAYLMHQPAGRGQIIAFAEDPNYRSYAEASQLLFVNAVLLGTGR